jgi:hypothetical protein
MVKKGMTATLFIIHEMKAHPLRSRYQSRVRHQPDKSTVLPTDCRQILLNLNVVSLCYRRKISYL